MQEALRAAIGPTLRDALTWLATAEESFAVALSGVGEQATTCSALLALPDAAAWLDASVWTAIEVRHMLNAGEPVGAWVTKYVVGIAGTLTAETPTGLITLTFAG